MSDVNTIIEAACLIFETVEGIKRVYREAPDQAPSGDLPCVIPVLQTLDPSVMALGGKEMKQYEIKFLLLVRTYGGSLVSVERDARPFADRVADAFFAHAKLNDNAIHEGYVGLMSYGRIEYNAGQSYVGWTIPLTGKLTPDIIINN
jgi:hypothetical protein